MSTSKALTPPQSHIGAMSALKPSALKPPPLSTLGRTLCGVLPRKILRVSQASTSKLIDPPLYHIKGKSVMKACWTDMPCNCWGEQCCVCVLSIAIVRTETWKLLLRWGWTGRCVRAMPGPRIRSIARSTGECYKLIQLKCPREQRRGACHR